MTQKDIESTTCDKDIFRVKWCIKKCSRCVNWWLNDNYHFLTCTALSWHSKWTIFDVIVNESSNNYVTFILHYFTYNLDLWIFFFIRQLFSKFKIIAISAWSLQSIHPKIYEKLFIIIDLNVSNNSCNIIDDLVVLVANMNRAYFW